MPSSSNSSLESPAGPTSGILVKKKEINHAGCSMEENSLKKVEIDDVPVEIQEHVNNSKLY